MQRYQWRKPSESPDKIELVDQVTNQPIGIILGAGRKWHWHRKTSVLLHGAPPAEGVCGRLADAKDQLLDGLPS